MQNFQRTLLLTAKFVLFCFYNATICCAHRVPIEQLFGGRGEFQSTVSIVKTQNSPHWKNITFQVRVLLLSLLSSSFLYLTFFFLLQIFDVPSMGDKPFEERIEFARKLFGKGGKYASMERIKVLEQEKVKDREHVLDKLKEIEELGGEGVMLRMPQS